MGNPDKPGNGQDADDLDNIAAGEEIDESAIDDAERDEIAERERQAAERGEQPPSPEDILADVRKAMTEEAPAPETDEQKAAREAAEKAAKDKADGATPPGDGKATPATPDATKEAEAKEAERKAAVDREFNALQKAGKDKTRDRFHELNRTVAEQAEALTALGALAGKDKDGKDLAGPAAVAAIKGRMEQSQQFEDAIFSSGITADDFKNVASYKHAINSDDPVAWENARQFLRNELEWLETERMGLRAKDPATDAYAAHADLAEDVASGALSKERANEIAGNRNLLANAGKAKADRATATGTEEQRNAAAVTCGDYAAALQAADAAQFAAKWPALKAKLGELQATVPPDQWLGKLVEAYKAIPYTPAAAAPAQPAQPQQRTPLRPGQLPRAGARRPGGRDAGHPMQREEETDPYKAMRGAMLEAGGASPDED